MHTRPTRGAQPHCTCLLVHHKRNARQKPARQYGSRVSAANIKRYRHRARAHGCLALPHEPGVGAWPHPSPHATQLPVAHRYSGRRGGTHGHKSGYLRRRRAHSLPHLPGRGHTPVRRPARACAVTNTVCTWQCTWHVSRRAPRSQRLPLSARYSMLLRAKPHPAHLAVESCHSDLPASTDSETQAHVAEGGNKARLILKQNRPTGDAASFMHVLKSTNLSPPGPTQSGGAGIHVVFAMDTHRLALCLAYGSQKPSKPSTQC